MKNEKRNFLQKKMFEFENRVETKSVVLFLRSEMIPANNQKISKTYFLQKKMFKFEIWVKKFSHEIKKLSANNELKIMK